MSLETLTQRRESENYRAYLAGYLESAASLTEIVSEGLCEADTAEAMAVRADIAEARARLDRAARSIFPTPSAQLTTSNPNTNERMD